MPVNGEKSAIRSVEIAAAVNSLHNNEEKWNKLKEMMLDPNIKVPKGVKVMTDKEYPKMFHTDFFQWKLLGIDFKTPQVFDIDMKRPENYMHGKREERYAKFTNRCLRI